MNRPLPHDYPEMLADAMKPADRVIPINNDAAQAKPGLTQVIAIIVLLFTLAMATNFALDIIEYRKEIMTTFEQVREAITANGGWVCRIDNIGGVVIDHCVRTTARL